MLALQMKIETKRKLTSLNEIKVTFNCAMTKNLHTQQLFNCCYLPRFFQDSNFDQKKPPANALKVKLDYQV